MKIEEMLFIEIRRAIGIFFFANPRDVPDDFVKYWMKRVLKEIQQE